MKTYRQASAYASPWTRREQIGILLWEYCWMLFCSWTPKPFNSWRLFWLRLFGAHLHGTPFVHQRARIQLPWHLTMHDRACLGDRANAYSLGSIEIGVGATVAQEAYLCTGTHDFTSENLPLQTAPIRIGAGAFIGLRAVVLPGIEIGVGAVIGASSVVTKDVAPNTVVAGNPCRVLRLRTGPVDSGKVELRGDE
ncbi:MAG: putative colanic acid biosynthesis acetyltransferase [Chthoniobacter sp.]|nr:putative colanic acid biosynthesis acetyltransferase [Chthoniobacter sp.]